MNAKPMVLASIVVALLTLVGCTKKDSGAVTSATTVADVTSTTSTVRSTTTTDRASASTTTIGSPTTSQGGEPSGGCPTQADIDDLTSGMDEAFASGTGADYIAQVNDALDVLDSYMPPDYDADLMLIRSGFDALGEALEGIDFSNPGSITPEQLQRLEASGGLLDGPALDNAQQRVQDYFATSCPELAFP